MIKNKSALEVKINDRVYSFELSNDSPLGEAYDAITQMRGFIIDRMVEEHNKTKPKQPENEKS